MLPSSFSKLSLDLTLQHAPSNLEINHDGPMQFGQIPIYDDFGGRRIVDHVALMLYFLKQRRQSLHLPVPIPNTLSILALSSRALPLTPVVPCTSRSSPSLSLPLPLPLSLPSLSISFFWTRNERAPSGVTSEATQHCCENNCHNIHYHDQAKQTVKKDIW